MNRQIYNKSLKYVPALSGLHRTRLKPRPLAQALEFMKPILIAGLLFATAVVSGIVVSYISVQGSYQSLERDTQFLREALRGDLEHRSQIYLTNLEKLLNGQIEDAITFNCIFLKSELARLRPFQKPSAPRGREPIVAWDKASELVTKAEGLELCSLASSSENEL